MDLISFIALTYSGFMRFSCDLAYHALFRSDLFVGQEFAWVMDGSRVLFSTPPFSFQFGFGLVQGFGYFNVRTRSFAACIVWIY